MRWLDSMAQWLLRASERHLFIGPLSLGFVLFGIAQAILVLGFGGIPHDLAAASAVEIVLLLAGVSIPLILVTVAFGPVFAKVAGISRTAQHPLRTFIRHYLVTSLGVMQDQFASLQSGAGLSLAIAEMDEVSGWVPTFFSSAQGKYVGFDSSLPDEYLKRWSGYLRHLEHYEPGVRLRVVTSLETDLISDIASHPASAKHLQGVHDDMTAVLLCLDEREVRHLAESHRLPYSVVDLALWEEDYCLLWERGDERFTVRLVFADDPVFKRVQEFVSDVEAKAKPLTTFMGGAQGQGDLLAQD